jgi:hypothetical protein
MMSQFEFIFTLYSLLLGLSLVELLSGLGRTVKARLHVDETVKDAFKIGWLTPLLGLFVMLDLLSFWSAAWAVRDMISVNGATLMAIMLFASSYYMAAHLVFPDDIPTDGDLDPHYFRVRRIVVGVLFVLLFVQLGYYLTQPTLAARLASPVPLFLTALLVVLMVAVSLVKSKIGNGLLLSGLIIRYVVVYVL